MRTSLLLLALALSACSDDEPSAPLTPGGGGPHEVAVNRDAGSGEEDAGESERPDASSDAPLPRECLLIDAKRFTTDEIPSDTSTTSPADFLVTRQAATWRDGCESPTLVIELSNGACPNGSRHELEIMLSVNAITDGTIGLGLNLIGPEMDLVEEAIRVRYTRPQRFNPVGVFGTCDGSEGQITFYDAPDVSRPMDLRARYEFYLTPCDSALPTPEQFVSGFFDVRVRRSLDAVCP